MKEWYPIYTKSRFEKSVYSNLIRAGIESYLPLQLTMRQWSDRKKWVEIPLFNSYLFVKILKTDFQKVLNIRGTSSFLNFNGRPAKIANQEIDIIKKLINCKSNIEIKNGTSSIGELITIQEGLLAGYQGKIIKSDKKRVIIELVEFNKSIIVNID